jgi:DNA-binding protein YbaB
VDAGRWDQAALSQAMAEQAGFLREFTGRLDGVRGHGEGADGLVRVEVTAGGRVTDLRLDPRVMRLGSELLTEQIMAAIRAAVADGEQQVQEAMAALPSNPSWEDLIAGTGQVDPSTPLPPIPDSASLNAMLRRHAH